MKLFLINLLLILIFSGCSAKLRFKEAQWLERNGYYIEACMRYEKIYSKYPASPLSPEAAYRIGSIYKDKLKLLSQACVYYKKVIDLYPKSEPWAKLAKQGLLSSPDYFPLSLGSFWIEGDSDTKGSNMRSEWTCSEASSGTYTIKRRVFAGKKFVNEIKRYYRRENLEVQEYEDKNMTKYTPIITYPYIEGKTWKAGTKTLKIVLNSAALKVKAGEFSNCIKISEEDSILPGSIKYNYYAPDTGWILTTASAVGGKEHNIAELLSYKIMPEK